MGGGIYRVNFFNRQKINLLLEGGERLQIVADGYEDKLIPSKSKVYGSKTMEYFGKIIAWVSETQKKIIELKKQFSEANSKLPPNAEPPSTKELEISYKQQTDSLQSKIRNLVPEMGTSLATLYASNYLDIEQNLELFGTIADRFLAEKPHSLQGKVFARGVNRVRGLRLGQVAPDIHLETLEGKKVPLSSLKGKWVLVDFWASWCGPCRKENPNLVLTYEKYKDKGFEIYGISLDNDKEAWKAAILRDKLSWINVSDLKNWNSVAVLDYNITMIPMNFLLDKEGKIMAKNLRGELLETKLLEVFK